MAFPPFSPPQDRPMKELVGGASCHLHWRIKIDALPGTCSLRTTTNSRVALRERLSLRWRFLLQFTVVDITILLRRYTYNLLQLQLYFIILLTKLLMNKRNITNGEKKLNVAFVPRKFKSVFFIAFFWRMLNCKYTNFFLAYTESLVAIISLTRL